jgi:hypothetical protein
VAIVRRLVLRRELEARGTLFAQVLGNASDTGFIEPAAQQGASERAQVIDASDG